MKKLKEKFSSYGKTDFAALIITLVSAITLLFTLSTSVFGGLGGISALDSFTGVYNGGQGNWLLITLGIVGLVLFVGEIALLVVLLVFVDKEKTNKFLLIFVIANAGFGILYWFAGMILSFVIGMGATMGHIPMVFQLIFFCAALINKAIQDPQTEKGEEIEDKTIE